MKIKYFQCIPLNNDFYENSLMWKSNLPFHPSTWSGLSADIKQETEYARQGASLLQVKHKEKQTTTLSYPHLQSMKNDQRTYSAWFWLWMETRENPWRQIENKGGSADQEVQTQKQTNKVKWHMFTWDNLNIVHSKLFVFLFHMDIYREIHHARATFM